MAACSRPRGLYAGRRPSLFRYPVISPNGADEVVMSHDGTLPALARSLFMGRYWHHYTTHCLSVGVPHRAVGDPVNPRAAGRDANVYARCLCRG